MTQRANQPARRPTGAPSSNVSPRRVFAGLLQGIRWVAIGFYGYILAVVAIAPFLAPRDWYLDPVFFDLTPLLMAFALALGALLIFLGAKDAQRAHLFESRSRAFRDRDDPATRIPSSTQTRNLPFSKTVASCEGGASSRPHLSFGAALALATIALAAFQLFIVRGAFFETDWDVAITTGIDASKDFVGSYLSLYPFQATLFGLFDLLGSFAGPWGSNRFYLALVLWGIACVDGSLAMLATLARELFDAFWSWCAWGLGVVLIGLSPWILVPYSDVFSMPFVIGTVFLYGYCLPRSQKPPVIWACIGFVGLLGYSVKATAIFALVAVVGVALCRALAGERARLRPLASKRATLAQTRAETLAPKATPRTGSPSPTAQNSTVSAKAPTISQKRGATIALSIGACALGMVVAFGVARLLGTIGAAGASLEEGRAISMSHYLMMGAGGNGYYSQDDVDFSTSIADPDERTRKNLEEWRRRVSELGIEGTQELAIKKVLSTFSSGTFTWAHEGNFFFRFPIEGYDVVREAYGIPTNEQVALGIVSFTDGGTLPPPSEAWYFRIAQVAWLLVLLSVVANAFDLKTQDPIFACMAILLALGLFLLVFECRGRYLLLSLPCFCLVAISGLRCVARRVASIGVASNPTPPKRSSKQTR